MPKKRREDLLAELKKIKNILITDDVINFILEMESKAADKVIRSLQLLSEFGFYLPKTYYHRLWESNLKLWELITSFGKDEYRSLFFSVDKGKYLIAHAIVKVTGKVPTNEIRIAEKVYIEWLNEGGN